MFSDLVLKNRSYRSFDMTKRVGEENLRKYVDLARITASTANLQALKYRIVHTEEECEKALSCTKWAGGFIRNIKIGSSVKAVYTAVNRWDFILFRKLCNGFSALSIVNTADDYMTVFRKDKIIS